MNRCNNDQDCNELALLLLGSGNRRKWDLRSNSEVTDAELESYTMWWGVDDFQFNDMSTFGQLWYWWQELNNCASKDCLWRAAWSDGLQHCGLSRQGARRQSINLSLGIVFILSSGSATMLTEFGLCYPSYDHPETAGSIECNFVLGKADEHFQSW